MESNYNAFMKANKKIDKTEYEYPASKSFVDEKGEVIKWKFKKLPVEMFNSLKDKYTKTEMVGSGKNIRYIPILNAEGFNKELIVSSCVYPNLNNEELQNSYGVKDSVGLLFELITDPGEYTDLVVFVQGVHGFKSFSEMVDDAKN